MYNCDFLFWLSNLTNFAQKKEVCQNRLYFIENIRIAENIYQNFLFLISVILVFSQNLEDIWY